MGCATDTRCCSKHLYQGVACEDCNHALSKLRSMRRVIFKHGWATVGSMSRSQDCQWQNARREMHRQLTCAVVQEADVGLHHHPLGHNAAHIQPIPVQDCQSLQEHSLSGAARLRSHSSRILLMLFSAAHIMLHMLCICALATSGLTVAKPTNWATQL